MTSEPEGDNVSERPRIADKVQFWEEQDRINREIIPRVLKIHEILVEHVAGHEAASTQIATLEARLTHRIRSARFQGMLLGSAAFVVALLSIVLVLLLT